MHDAGRLRETVFTHQCAAALCATEPAGRADPDAVAKAAATAVNVHGHLRAAEHRRCATSTSGWNTRTTPERLDCLVEAPRTR